MIKFLNSKSLKWKKKFILGFNSVNGVFAPTAVALLEILVGYNPGILSFYSFREFKEICNQWITFYSLIPQPKNSLLNQVF